MMKIVISMRPFKLLRERSSKHKRFATLLETGIVQARNSSVLSQRVEVLAYKSTQPRLRKGYLLATIVNLVAISLAVVVVGASTLKVPAGL